MFLNRLVALFAAMTLTTFSCAAQNLISAELIASYDLDEMSVLVSDFLGGLGDDLPLSEDDILNMLNVTHPVNVYQILYNTEHPVLGTIQASGAYSFPIGLDCALPVVIYQHGTTFGVQDVPSFLSIEHNVGAILSSSGYASLMPDYMGLGDSEGMHPYVHADTEAQAGVDLARAARELQEDLNVELKNEFYITGYSQGGHAAMALFHEMETNLSDEFFVAGASPMSGPYAVYEVQEQVMWQDYSSPDYLPYLLLGYISVYPELEEYSSIWKPEFDQFNNFEGDASDFLPVLTATDCPSNPSTMVKQEFIDEYQSDDNHPLKVVLKDNNRFDWTPSAPVLLSGCCDDEQVMYENAIFTENKFIENGATDVSRIDFCTLFGSTGFLGHGGCIPYCMLWTKNFFDDIVTDCAVSNEDLDQLQIDVFPNPASDYARISLPGGGMGSFKINLVDLNGHLSMQRESSHQESLELDLSEVNSGLYVLEIVKVDGNGSQIEKYRQRLIVQ